jgi:hypothetical protein
LISYRDGTLTAERWTAILDSWRKTIPRLKPATDCEHGSLAILLADELGLNRDHLYAMTTNQYAWLELLDDDAKAVCGALTRVGCDSLVQRWQYIRDPSRWGTS